MEKALVKVGSIKAGGFWLTKKAKEEINNITDDLSVSKFFFFFFYFPPFFCISCFVSFNLTSLLSSVWNFESLLGFFLENVCLFWGSLRKF